MRKTVSHIIKNKNTGLTGMGDVFSGDMTTDEAKTPSKKKHSVFLNQ